MQDSLGPGLPGEKPSLLTLCFPILFVSILNTTLSPIYRLTRCSSSFDGRKWRHTAVYSKARQIHPSVRRNPKVH